MMKEGLVEEVHKPVRKNFPRRKVILKGLNDLWQIDLIEMIPYANENDGFRYILTVINAFSKYVYVEPIKRKTGKDVTDAMEKILKSVIKPPKNLQADQGTEFYNYLFKKLMKSYNINLYSVFSTKKACIVERVIRTLKTKLWKIFSLQGNYKWMDVINSIVQEYNHKVHRTIGMKPADVSLANEQQVLDKLSTAKLLTIPKQKFNKGDYVRISKVKSIFEKGYTPNWSAEVFRIAKVQITTPVTYILEDLKENPIKGCFYPQEIRKTKFKDVYLVEKVLRKKKNKAFVKWWGFDTTHNEWINTKDIL